MGQLRATPTLAHPELTKQNFNPEIIPSNGVGSITWLTARHFPRLNVEGLGSWLSFIICDQVRGRRINCYGSLSKAFSHIATSQQQLRDWEQRRGWGGSWDSRKKKFDHLEKESVRWKVENGQKRSLAEENDRSQSWLKKRGTGRSRDIWRRNRNREELSEQTDKKGNIKKRSQGGQSTLCPSLLLPLPFPGLTPPVQWVSEKVFMNFCLSVDWKTHKSGSKGEPDKRRKKDWMWTQDRWKSRLSKNVGFCSCGIAQIFWQPVRELKNQKI